MNNPEIYLGVIVIPIKRALAQHVKYSQSEDI